MGERKGKAAVSGRKKKEKKILLGKMWFVREERREKVREERFVGEEEGLIKRGERLSEGK